MRAPNLAIAALAGLLLAAPADAKKKDDEGVPVIIKVLDLEGEPVSTAVVRHPEEADRHRVNALTGEVPLSVLYLPDGGELIFKAGTTVTFEVSAPGFMTQIIQYDIRKRKNRLEVLLPPLPIEEDEEIEEPLIQFGRDRPRDVGPAGPAN